MNPSEITFAAYMEKALYGPEGYYSSGRARTGREGDYFTAPETGGVFAELLWEIFVGWQARLGSDPFHLVEVGAGEGALASALVRLPARCRANWNYTAVERSPARRTLLEAASISLPRAFRILPDLDVFAQAPVSGCFFANELIDAFPVHRVRRRGGKLEEAFVRPGEAAHLTWGPLSTDALAAYFRRLGIELPEGYETEVNLAMAGWIRSVAPALKQGIVLIIDYGRPARDYYAPERCGGTLRGFRRHRVISDILAVSEPVDLTADVDFTSLALDAREAGLAPLAFMEMGSFLMAGARKLLENGSPHAEFKRTALRYLIHPEGLGSAFHVLILGKGETVLQWRFEANRLSRLGLPA